MPPGAPVPPQLPSPSQFIALKGSWTTPPCPLTIEEALEAEELGPSLPLDGVGAGLGSGTGPCPEDLALAEPEGEEILALELQDEPSVQHVQQLVGVEALLLVGNGVGRREGHLLQRQGPEELLLLPRGLQAAVEQPAAVRVADGQGTHLAAPVLELQLQVSHCRRATGSAGPGSPPGCHPHPPTRP